MWSTAALTPSPPAEGVRGCGVDSARTGRRETRAAAGGNSAGAGGSIGVPAYPPRVGRWDFQRGCAPIPRQPHGCSEAARLPRRRRRRRRIFFTATLTRQQPADLGRLGQCAVLCLTHRTAWQSKGQEHCTEDGLASPRFRRRSATIRYPTLWD
eukprot:9497826-Pyramimonas_sp.AAC.2